MAGQKLFNAKTQRRKDFENAGNPNVTVWQTSVACQDILVLS
jgi:hypothetical protein